MRRQGCGPLPREGNADVWHLLDMADSKREKRPPNAALVAWERAVADVAAGKRDRKALEEVADEVQQPAFLPSQSFTSHSTHPRFAPARVTLASPQATALRKKVDETALAG